MTLDIISTSIATIMSRAPARKRRGGCFMSMDRRHPMEHVMESLQTASVAPEALQTLIDRSAVLLVRDLADARSYADDVKRATSRSSVMNSLRSHGMKQEEAQEAVAEIMTALEEKWPLWAFRQIDAMPISDNELDHVLSAVAEAEDLLKKIKTIDVATVQVNISLLFNLNRVITVSDADQEAMNTILALRNVKEEEKKKEKTPDVGSAVRTLKAMLANPAVDAKSVMESLLPHNVVAIDKSKPVTDRLYVILSLLHSNTDEDRETRNTYLREHCPSLFDNTPSDITLESVREKLTTLSAEERKPFLKMLIDFT